MEKLLKNTMIIFLSCIAILVLLTKVVINYMSISKIICTPIIVVAIGSLLYFFDSKRLYSNAKGEKLLIILPVISILLVRLINNNLSSLKDIAINLLFILIGGLINLIIKKLLYDKWIIEV